MVSSSRGSEVRSGERIHDLEVSEEMNTSFLEYAMSVIVARALPDVRDGLKPVHRRILYTMFTSGMRPDSPYKKSARTVGSVIGKFHPHGDSAVYEAMVRLAQPWSMRLPLIDGHGNFGSLDDGPAAMRYTEARLSHSALAMLDELSEQTVDFSPNYDGTETEPTVLPALIPNLLVNGSTGIAVGMATNMPPHSLSEVVGMLRVLLHRPDAPDDELMQLLPGPDFPSGGVVVLGEGYGSAFRTGQGSVTLRAKAEIVDSGRRRSIVVTELPYTVGPEKVIARIKEMSAAKRLTGVADVKDFSDRRTGLRLVIECRSGFAPEALLDDLFRLTPLEESFFINNVALVDDVPVVMGTRELALHFLSHRRTVVRRRSEFRLRKAKDRAHIAEGLLLALADLDRVVAVVRAAKDPESARNGLIADLGLSEVQAQAVLDMTIRRLTGLERGKLEKELKDLFKGISSLEKLLASEKKLSAEVERELCELAERFGDERRSRLLKEAPRSPISSIGASGEPVEDTDCVVMLSPAGALSRAAMLDSSLPRAAAVETTLRSHIGVVFSDGIMVRMPASDVLAGPGSPALALRPGSKVQVSGLADLRSDSRVVLALSSGAVKAFLSSSLPARGDVRPVVRLSDGESVVYAASDSDLDGSATNIVIVAASGRILRFSSATVASKGLAAGGMAGMRLSAGDTVISASLVPSEPDGWSVGLLSDAGRVKVLGLSDVPAKGRGTGGVIGLPFRKGETKLVTAVAGQSVVPISARGAALNLKLFRASRASSASEPAKPVYSFAVVG